MITVASLYLIMVKLNLLDSTRKFAAIFKKVLQIDFI